jgi:hypothetical protein
MNGYLAERKYVIAGVVLTVANVIFIWGFRFLPLYDYPIWLFETKVLHEFLRPDSSYHIYFELILTPIPNLTFTAFTYVLSWIVSLEAAGKLFLTLCVVGFPWSLWYCIRSLSPNPDPALAYIGFPYSYNLFMFGGHNYVLRLTLLLFMVGYSIPRFDRLSSKQWVLLSLGFLGAYFTHAIPWVLALLVFLCVSLSSQTERWRKFINVSVAVFPSLMAFGWYIAAVHLIGAPSGWSLASVVRNVLKPIFLFIKTYGIESPVPVTLLNVLWFAILMVVGVILGKACLVRKLWDKRFIVPTLVSGLMMLFLPDNFLGMWQSGARFVFPLLFFFFFVTLRVTISPKWKAVFLTVAFVVTIYNAFHFQKVDKQLTAFYGDLQAHEFNLTHSFYVLGFDWPADATIWDRGSASINPLFGAPYYASLEGRGLSWVHETGILKMKESFRRCIPDIRGETISEYHASVLAHVQALRFFKSVAVVGRGKETKDVIHALEKLGFSSKCTSEFWTLLMLE